MLMPIPVDVLQRFDSALVKRNIPDLHRSDYRKWIGYYLDFRKKYPRPGSRSVDVREFIEKLRSKNQTKAQQSQAARAVSLLFEIQPKQSAVATDTASPVRFAPQPLNIKPQQPSKKTPNRYDEWWCMKPTKSPDWDRTIDTLASEIKTRHYSRKTLKAYAEWSRKFQLFLVDKAPSALSPEDVKAYLTYLAVTKNVSASTQNQAFNSLLFLFRHVLKSDFGDHKDIPRAKKSKYIPIVLSRREVDAVTTELSQPVKLVVLILYGCGLRIFEALKLRVQDFNFESNILTVRGKGQKGRTVPIPQAIKADLLAQLELVKKMHEDDLNANFAGVFLDNSLELKYPRAAKELIWQWFFPQQSLTLVAEAREMRRYHLHEKRVQDELYDAVRRAKLTKRVTCHTFRHSFATHLLQANYDLRTIQTLLGHADIRTTMIYTHCIPSRPEKEVKSPLDLYQQ